MKISRPNGLPSPKVQLTPQESKPANDPVGQDKFEPSQDDGKRSGATKLGMAAAVVGTTYAGYRYGGVLGALFGAGAGTSIARSIDKAEPEVLTGLMAAGAGAGVVAVGGHFLGALGVLLAGGAAAGAANFVLS